MGPASCFYFTETLVFEGVELRFSCSSQTSNCSSLSAREVVAPCRGQHCGAGAVGAQQEKQATLGPLGQVLQGETAQ